MASKADAVVVGSGPNGLAAAIELARNGLDVELLEAGETVGGGMRTRELTLPGFLHDECSAIHPLGILSPCFRQWPLAEHGLEWVQFPASVAHPLDDGPAPMLYRSLDETAARLGPDGERWRRLIVPFLDHPHDLLADLMGPVRPFPRRPLKTARFGWHGLRPALRFARARFETSEARALFAGCAGHAVLPLEFAATTALGLLFAITAHVADWPCARGGSASIARALERYFRSLSGRVRVGHRVRSLDDVPDARAVLCDLTPRPFVEIARDALPERYCRRLLRYRYGPGTFKVDWALSDRIPWRDPAVADASTVHVGGTLEEIAESEADAWRGRHPERPYVILCQQSNADPSRAPSGKHTGYAYCHVPNGSDVDMSERIERQIERFAPGFRDCVLARHATGPRELEALNPNYVGGAVTGGASDLRQLFTRPVPRLNPYTTPNPRLFLCSASTPPGGGVHGMCGYHAARAVLRRLRRRGQAA
ncbi:MAG: phytoene desaturase family protein [Planctomycetota bacterium]|jgi:phytoene dehydrogenase-like protein